MNTVVPVYAQIQHKQASLVISLLFNKVRIWEGSAYSRGGLICYFGRGGARLFGGRGRLFKRGRLFEENTANGI